MKEEKIVFLEAQVEEKESLNHQLQTELRMVRARLRSYPFQGNQGQCSGTGDRELQGPEGTTLRVGAEHTRAGCMMGRRLGLKAVPPLWVTLGT